MGSPAWTWYVEKDWDVAVAIIPKCGSQSIREWLHGSRGMTNDDPRLIRISNRVAFIRNPFERLKSCYSFFYWMSERSPKHYNGIPLDCWESFVDHVVDGGGGEGARMWELQTVIIENIANKLHRFEDIREIYSRYRPGILPHNNIATRCPTTDYRLNDIANKYALDIELWEGLN